MSLLKSAESEAARLFTRVKCIACEWWSIIEGHIEKHPPACPNCGKPVRVNTTIKSTPAVRVLDPVPVTPGTPFEVAGLRITPGHTPIMDESGNQIGSAPVPLSAAEQAASAPPASVPDVPAVERFGEGMPPPSAPSDTGEFAHEGAP